MTTYRGDGAVLVFNESVILVRVSFEKPLLLLTMSGEIRLAMPDARGQSAG